MIFTTNKANQHYSNNLYMHVIYKHLHAFLVYSLPFRFISMQVGGHGEAILLVGVMNYV